MAIPNDPNLLFLDDPYYKRSVFGNYYIPVSFSLFGFGMACALNRSKGKPGFSGIQQHIIWMGAGYLLGDWVKVRRQAWIADRDTMYKHYIETHPDDFPSPERKKFKDIIKPWYPIR